MRRPGAFALPLILVAAVAAAAPPETLEDVLRESRAANARLPIPAIELEIARERRARPARSDG